MASSNNLVLQLLITARDTASEALGQVGAGVRGIGNAVSAALEPLRSFGGLMAAVIGIGGAKELLDRADAYTRLTNSLKVATASEAAFQQALAEVASVANRTNSDLGTTASLYARVSQNATAMGLSQREVVDLTELISKGMQLGGASAAEYASATLQLTQAFGSGVLRGEEFNAVMEASPELMRRLAAGLGIAVGELRGLAEQGVLTSNIVSKALLSQVDVINTAYAETTQTVEQAFTNLGSKVTLFVGGLGESTGVTQGATQALKFLADNLGVVTAALGGALTAALVKSTVAMGGYVQQSLAARAAAADQALAAAAQQRANIATAEGHVAAALAAQNQAMAEQRLAQQQLLAIEAIAGLFASEEALTLARSQASAAAQASTTATQRLAAAQSALIAAQGGAAASSTLLSRALGFLAGPGGLILAAVSAFALLLPLLSKSKTSTDELTQSTDQYQQSLEKLNTAQLTAKTLEINAAIREQEEAVAEARAAVDALADGQISLFEVMRDGRPAAVQLAEAQGALADEEQQLNTLSANLRATTDALVRSQQRQAQTSAGQLVQFVQQGLAMQRLAGTIEELGQRQKALSTAEQERIKNEIQLAEAAGDYQRVEELTLQLIAERNRQAEQQAAADHAAAVAAQARVAALQSQYQAQVAITPTEEKALIAAQADAAIKSKQAEASRALVTALQGQTGTLEASLITEKQAVTSAKKYSDAVEGAAQAQLGAKDAEIALAEAKGDTAEVQRLTIERAQLEADLGVKVARAKQAEQEAEVVLAQAHRDQLAVLVSKGQATQQALALAELGVQKELAEAQAAGVNTQAQEVLAQKLRAVNAAKAGATEATGQNTEATGQNTEATEKNSEARGKGVSIQYVMNEALKGATERTRELSAATGVLFEKMFLWLNNKEALTFSGEIEKYRYQLNEVQDEYAEITQKIAEMAAASRQADEDILFAANSVIRYFAYLQKAEAEASRAFYEQKLRAEQLADQYERTAQSGASGFQSVRAALTALNHDATVTVGSLHLLDEQDLSRLQSAIDAANDKLREMQDETQSAKDRLAELNADILEAQGQDQKAELLRQQLDYQQQLAELEKQRTDAERTGNRELLAILNQQQSKLQELNRIKIANIEADAGEDRATTRLNALATAAERAGSALRDVGGVDLTAVSTQAERLTKSFSDLNGVL